MTTVLSSAQKYTLFEKISAFRAKGKSEREAVKLALSLLDVPSGSVPVTFESARAMYKRMKASAGKLHGNALFSAEEEEAFVGLLQGFSMLSRGLTKQAFIRSVMAAKPELTKAKKGWDADGWFAKFMQRHSTRLTQRTIKGLKSERLGDDVEAQVKDFVQWFPDWMASKGLSTKGLVQADETRIKIDNSQHKAKTIEVKGKRKYGGVEATKGKAASMIPFFSTDGALIMLVYVIPSDSSGVSSFFLREISRSSHDSVPTYYMFTDTGLVDEDAWLAILKTFKKEWDLRNPGLEPVLLLDKLAVHMTDASLLYCLENHIHTAFFPANATHFLQPADDKLFANFKRALQRALQQYLVSIRHNSRDLGAALLGLAQDLVGMMTKPVILASWRDTGIHPWNAELILENAKKNAGGMGQADSGDTSACKLAREAAQHVIRESLGESKKRAVRVKGPRQKLFSGEEILALEAQQVAEEEEKKDEKARQKKEEKEKREAEKEMKKEQKKREREKQKERTADAKKAKREQRTMWACQGSLHGDDKKPIWRGAEGWMWCDHCENFGVCPKCLKADQRLLGKHEKKCGGKK